MNARAGLSELVDPFEALIVVKPNVDQLLLTHLLVGVDTAEAVEALTSSFRLATASLAEPLPGVNRGSRG